jgi:hypothetical protein
MHFASAIRVAEASDLEKGGTFTSCDKLGRLCLQLVARYVLKEAWHQHDRLAAPQGDPSQDECKLLEQLNDKNGKMVSSHKPVTVSLLKHCVIIAARYFWSNQI